MTPHAPDPHPPDPRADDAHDAWLDHALRHAPDASADAPAALSDAILRSARSAVTRRLDAPAPAATATATAPAPPAPRHRRRSLPLLSAWAWAWLAKPPVAAGFGSVMVATLVGVLWWGRPLDEALPQAPTLASAPAPVRAARQAKAETPAPPTVAAAPAAVATASPLPSPTSSKRQADKAAPTAPPDARATRREASKQAAANQAEPTPVPQIPAPAAAGATPAGEPARETPQAAAPSLAEARERASSAPLDGRLTRPFSATASGTAANSAANSAASRTGPTRAITGPGSADAALMLARPADAGRAPLTALLAAVAREPERWRWGRDDSAGDTLAMTPSLLRWLAELDRATASQWRQASVGATRDGPSTLRLLRDGVLQATLRFDASARLEIAGDAAPKMSTATLPAASVEALKKSLEEATR